MTEKLKALGITAMELNPEQHIGTQAAFQENVDNAVSKTINYPSTATKEDIMGGYLAGHKKGCKGLTVYRDGSKGGQILEAIIDESEDSKPSAGRPKELLAIVRSEIIGEKKTLFVTTSKHTRDAGRIEFVEVDVPGVGLP